MRVELSPVRYWRHDLSHCLHNTAGVLLDHHGLDPVQALGAAWGFHYPGDMRREEYYLPGAADDLFAGLAPHHDISSRWHRPDDVEQGWRQVRERLAAGEIVGVAADNYHLPFRPAYRDVHTNHLLAVYGFDDARGEVLVADPTPPSYQGPIPLEEFNAARDSGNPVVHERDMFFTSNPIGNRWLEVTVGADQPEFTPDFVGRVVEANVRGLLAPDTPSTSGLSGLRAFLNRVGGAPEASPVDADEAFVVIGPILAVTGLHAEFLSRAGHDSGDRRLAELSRAVDAVAHHWSALRIAVATAGTPGDREGVRVRADRLVAAHERAAALMERVPASL
ncbi:BtrH N-terminal domain-containing protein [Nocardiopsis sp. FIRDI 009]|uniref:BtrH N-terminal domain-containing protein n=1 Tax=Nocardiopsis sp. FIRDI 009 TaxID=714197 RepID=UPI001300AF0C|nr:BtrH N-terminal domain-containing protein [Nocardiopsis sp. FIRDI 009]